MSISSISAQSSSWEETMSPSAGGPARDFTLPATPNGEGTLSSFLGNQNVVLVFYKRGFPSDADILKSITG